MQILSDGETQHEIDSDDSEDELDKFLEQAKETKEDNPYAELEDFFQVDVGTGEAVGEHIAGISNKAVRGNKTKKEEKISKNNAETFTTKKHRKPSGSQDGRSPLAPTQEGRQAGGLCPTAGSGSILTSHGSSNQNNGSH